MISQLIAETGEQLVAYQRHEKDKSVKQKVEATQERLTELRRALSTFANDFQQVAHILQSEKRQYLQNTGKDLLVQLNQSHRNFEADRNQTSSLSGIVLSLNNLKSQLHGAWRFYVEEQIRPRRELYNLVESLPEVSRHQAEINALFQRLKHDAEHFPESANDRQRFQSQLEQLDHHLEAHRGLSPNIRRFLEQVRKKQFTVADLNEEILTWCREGDRGRAFKITF